MSSIYLSFVSVNAAPVSTQPLNASKVQIIYTFYSNMYVFSDSLLKKWTCEIWFQGQLSASRRWPLKVWLSHITFSSEIILENALVLSSTQTSLFSHLWACSKYCHHHTISHSYSIHSFRLFELKRKNNNQQDLGQVLCNVDTDSWYGLVWGKYFRQLRPPLLCCNTQTTHSHLVLYNWTSFLQTTLYLFGGKSRLTLLVHD